MECPFFLSPQKNVTLQCVFWVEDPTCEYEGVPGRDEDPQGWIRGGSDGGQGSVGGGQACRSGPVCMESMVVDQSPMDSPQRAALAAGAVQAVRLSTETRRHPACAAT